MQNVKRRSVTRTSEDENNDIPNYAKMGNNKKMRVLDVAKPKAELVKQSMCSATYIVSAVRTLSLVVFYYIFSISLTFYNQRFIKTFQYPLSITMTHLVFKFISSGMVRWIMECRSGQERVTLSWGQYIKRIGPTGLVSALDIGLSNWSFEFITISLYTMSKSSAIIFLLGFSLLLRLEKFRWSLVVVVLFVSGGLFLFTYHATQFNLEGFIMVIAASFLSGIRWTLAQFVTQKQEIGLGNPVDMMYHIQPWMILGLFPLSAAFEGIQVSTTDKFFRCEDLGVFMTNIGWLLLGASLAFMLEFSEFLLVSRTSCLTLSLSGVFKEICTLYLAAQFNGDRMSPINALGGVVCLLGITIHVILKAVYRNTENKKRVLERTPEHIEMLMSDGTANSGYEGDEEEDEIDVFNVKRDR